MKAKTLLVALALLGSAAAATPALAWGRGHSHVGVGFYFGVPVGGYAFYPHYAYPPYYPYYYPYPATVVVQPPQPQVYIEQPQAAPQQAAPQAQGYWYFCAGANAYYPYVRECPGGWQRVAPQPAQ